MQADEVNDVFADIPSDPLADDGALPDGVEEGELGGYDPGSGDEPEPKPGEFMEEPEEGDAELEPSGEPAEAENPDPPDAEELTPSEQAEIDAALERAGYKEPTGAEQEKVAEPEELSEEAQQQALEIEQRAKAAADKRIAEAAAAAEAAAKAAAAAEPDGATPLPIDPPKQPEQKAPAVPKEPKKPRKRAAKKAAPAPDGQRSTTRDYVLLYEGDNNGAPCWIIGAVVEARNTTKALEAGYPLLVKKTGVKEFAAVVCVPQSNWKPEPLSAETDQRLKIKIGK